MALSGFIYNGNGYDIRQVCWAKKQVECEGNVEYCPLKKSFGKCEDTLIKHCCKHVINGMQHEKDRYCEVMSECGKKDQIPDKIYGKNDQIIKDYEELSSMVIKDPASVSLTYDQKSVRVVCEGADSTDGLAVFMGFEKTDSFGGQKKKKHLGIVSAYFNMSSIETYVMFRLVYQRYFEKRSYGVHVSPVIGVAESSGEIELSTLDFAFSYAEQLYTCQLENPSLGAVYYFFWEKYVRKHYLDELYSGMTNALVPYRKRKLKQLVLGTEDSQVKAALNGLKKFEYIYAARTIVEYISIIAGSEFCPNRKIVQGEEVGLPYATDIFSRETGKYYKKSNMEKKYELIIQWKFLNIVGDRFSSIYSTVNLHDLANNISGYEMRGAEEGSIADQVSYSVASHLLRYFLSLFVFCHNFYECYDGQIDNEEATKIHREIIKWRRWKVELEDTLKGNLYREWLKIFDDLFRVEEKYSEIEKCYTGIKKSLEQ